MRRQASRTHAGMRGARERSSSHRTQRRMRVFLGAHGEVLRTRFCASAHTSIQTSRRECVACALRQYAHLRDCRGISSLTRTFCANKFAHGRSDARPHARTLARLDVCG
eukprot:383996-Pleurochrysis_carterae.AAC.1